VSNHYNSEDEDEDAHAQVCMFCIFHLNT
jgi:hypothetical protein